MIRPGKQHCVIKSMMIASKPPAIESLVKSASSTFEKVNSKVDAEGMLGFAHSVTTCRQECEFRDKVGRI